VRYIFGEKTGDRIADRIQDAIRGSGQLNRTQISALFAGNKTKAEIDRALQSLQSARLIRRAAPPEGAGRPAEVWQVCAGPDAGGKDA
jgi:predicted ArsR family transcriptional regulator